MSYRRHMSVIVMTVAVSAVACGTAAPPTPAIRAAHLEAIEGSDLKRVVVTADAAERIGIKTSALREEVVVRRRTVGGEVVSVDAGALLYVQATPSDLTRVDRRQPASVRPVTRQDTPVAGPAGALPSTANTTTPLTARVAERPAEATPARPALYYVVDGRAHGLTRGQRVMIDLPLIGGAALRTVLPYSAVLYDLRGVAWTYTQSAALTFVRHRVSVDYIEGNNAMLSDGPPVGTQVVIVGATELYGIEFKVGK